MELAVINTTLSEDSLANEINASHTRVKRDATSVGLNMIRIGILCKQAKKMLPHGQFLKWMAQHCPNITERHNRRYMKLVDEAGQDIQEHVNMQALTQAGFINRYDTDIEFQRQMNDSLQSYLSGRTMNEILADHGIIKINKKEEFGTNNPDGKNGAENVPPTPELLALKTRTFWFGSEEEGQLDPQKDCVLGSVLRGVKDEAVKYMSPQEKEAAAKVLRDAAEELEQA